MPAGHGWADTKEHNMGTTDESGRQRPTRNLPGRSSHKRHWWRWILASVVVLVVAGGFLAVGSLAGPNTPGLSLAPLNASGPGSAGSSIDGTWTVGKGSLAGYRVTEDFLWQHGTLVARTSAVTGRFVIAHGVVSSAALRVDLSAVTANGKAPSGLAGILDTAGHRDAVFTLTRPIVIGSEPAVDKTFTASATGLLAIHGITRPVTFAIAARHGGSELEATGSIPIVFSGWDIKAPFAVQNQGVAEFLLVMHQ
jgi:polyisoprenoid-binding protein YceI